MSGRVGLVTGGGSGIGRETARTLAAEGDHVAVVDINATGGHETVRLIEANGGSAEFIACDVSQDTAVAAAVGGLVERHGRLDFAHNNAGICPVGYTVETLPEEIWDRVIAVNLKGVWLCMKHEIAAMRRQGSGAIVNTSSICGLRATRLSTPYNTSKHGVIGLTLEAALDCAEIGLRINAVLPGAIDTPMAQGIEGGDRLDALAAGVPLGRAGQPQDIARAVKWLLSDEAGYVTGHSLVVDGGLSIPLATSGGG